MTTRFDRALEHAREVFAGQGLHGLVRCALEACDRAKEQTEAKVLAAVADEIERTREERDTLRDKLAQEIGEIDLASGREMTKILQARLPYQREAKTFEIGFDGKPRELSIEVLLKDRAALSRDLDRVRAEADRLRRELDKVADQQQRLLHVLNGGRLS